MTPIDGLDPAALLVVTALTLVPAALFLWWGFRPLGARVDLWARARGVPMTDETRPYVTARLHRARRWRTVGFTLGWLVPYGHLWLTRSAYDRPSLGSLALVGYVLAALAAELLPRRRSVSGAAELSVREVERYLPTAALRWVQVVAAASVVVAAAYAGLPRRQVAGWPDPGWIALGTVVVLTLLVAAQTLPRLVVRHPQPFHTTDLLTADDALRSWSAHAVTGALLGTMLMILSRQVVQLGTGSDVQLLRWTGPVGGAVLFVLGIVAFQSLSGYDWRWQVSRRPVPAPR
jgi:hypothetical protein